MSAKTDIKLLICLCYFVRLHNRILSIKSQ
uniref:Uncharacterized protein n=1 Tax=Siphoviridae sp. ctfR912 TaxID=2825596 RepID=A0A8S5QAK4_9CAUD|nr:MAG TPA: hypothetical protein [Siphoviridae sp. ctfR912]DAS47345.1 MAG TPA: hypothetical protein [Caudoviricetes sp.]DAT04321.1 MAG TPA: hypothetical protein [Caudoviricetes sp.]